ncbi:MAG: Gfo/Idh/MocA family oxidoreductase [Lentisphaeria bacterium]|nr:Gfo/Idh/MocA family oxidoreductase [Lentisphaeria bacterium]
METQTAGPTSCPEPPGLDRRQFTTGAAAGLLSMVVAPAALAQAPAPARGERLRLGMIGCGGRGSWIGGLFHAHGGYRLVAAADYFPDRANAFGDKHGVPPERRFSGLSCHRELLECDLDAVAIISPPWFHPEQVEAAVAAGRHVYLAKPVAVDAPGCRRIAAAAERARAAGPVLLVDFQTRAQALYQEALRRVHAGEIGEITFGEAKYHTGALGIQAQPGTPGARLRNWVFDKALSGDIITEQNIHSLDVMNWIMGKPPLTAYGGGGRKVRTQGGDCWDHFALVFRYDNGVTFTFSSKQYKDGGHDDGIVCNAFGSRGRLVTTYGGRVMIVGENSFPGGATGRIYQEGAENNIAAFHRCVTEGHCDNATVAPSVQSNLITILGRTAAYEQRVVSWDEIATSTAALDARLDQL